MSLRVWPGECLRWYLTRAKHPFKGYIVGHYWSWFCKPRVWVRYDAGEISVRLDDYLQQRIFFDGYYEQALVNWLKANLSGTDVFWDVGANIGAISIVAARLCRQVVAFEPDPRSLTLLRKHVDANACSNVDVVSVALGAIAGSAMLHQATATNTGMTSLVNRRASTVGAVAVPVMRADDYLREHPDLSPTVIKIDVEGAEEQVIEGARELLGACRPRAIVFEAEADTGRRPVNQRVMELFDEAGYDLHWFASSDGNVDDGMQNFLALPRRNRAA